MTERSTYTYTMKPGGCTKEDGCALAGKRGVCPMTRKAEVESIVAPAKTKNALYSPATIAENVRRPFHNALTAIGLRLRAGHDNTFLALEMARGERNLFSYECNLQEGRRGDVRIERTNVK